MLHDRKREKNEQKKKKVMLLASYKPHLHSVLALYLFFSMFSNDHTPAIYTAMRDNQYIEPNIMLYDCVQFTCHDRTCALGSDKFKKSTEKGEQVLLKKLDTLYATTIKVPIPMYTQLFLLDNINPFSLSLSLHYSNTHSHLYKYITNKY